jgi:hypothetical protein
LASLKLKLYCFKQTVVGIIVLLLFDLVQQIQCAHLPEGAATKLLTQIFTEANVQSHVHKIRRTVFLIIAYMIRNKLKGKALTIWKRLCRVFKNWSLMKKERKHQTIEITLVYHSKLIVRFIGLGDHFALLLSYILLIRVVMEYVIVDSELLL